MQSHPILEKINWYWHYRRVLSVLLLLTVPLLAFSGDAFFSVFFFSFLLFFAGNLCAQQLSDKKMLVSLFLGFLAGGAAFAVYTNAIVLTDKIMWRAAIQAAVWALATTVGVYNPNYAVRFFVFPAIKLKYVVFAFIVLNLLSIDNPGLYIAHLSGCLTGLLIGFTQTGIFLTFLKARKKKKARMYAEYNPQRPLNDDEYNALKAEKQKRIDIILDKISKNGYESLSKEEKEFLFKFGK